MKIAIYTRKSVFTESGESIQNQILMCEKYIKAKNFSEYVSIEIFSDEGSSAKNIKRDSLNKLIYMIQNRQIDLVIVYRLDRLTRNIADFVRLVELFEKENVHFISIKEEFDTSKPMGKAMLYMATIFAQLERETIAERVKDNMYLLAQKGYWLGGNLPTGYMSVKCQENGNTKYNLVQDEKEAKLVEFIYKLMLEKKSISKVSKFLQDNNIKSKNGNQFSNNSIREILLNPVYCKLEKEIFDFFDENNIKVSFEFEEDEKDKGLLVFGKRKKDKGKIFKDDMKNCIISKGSHKGIISARDWVFVQKFFKARKIHKPHNETALFSGKIICANCNNKMVFKANSKIKQNGIFYYICKTKMEKGSCFCSSKNINGRNIDEYIWGIIEERFYIQQNTINLYQNEKLIKKCKKEIDKIINIIPNLKNKSIIEQLEQKVDTYEQEIQKIKNQKFTNQNQELDIFQKRNIIDKYVKNIIWENNVIQIAFK